MWPAGDDEREMARRWPWVGLRGLLVSDVEPMGLEENLRSH